MCVAVPTLSFFLKSGGGSAGEGKGGGDEGMYGRLHTRSDLHGGPAR